MSNVSPMRTKPCTRRFQRVASSIALLALLLVVPVPRLAAQSGWTFVKEMSTPRWGAAAAAGPGGKICTNAANVCIYVFGGFNDSGELNSAEVYNPATDTWTPIADLPEGVRFPGGHRDRAAAATGPDGLIYVMGGANDQACHPPPPIGFGECPDLRRVDAYDPATNTWEHKADMTFARSGLAAATGPDGRIYAMGGAGLNVVEAYTPATNTWTTVTPMSTTRINFGAATGSDGRIYAIGGRPNVLTNEVNTVEAFDTATRLWTPVAPMKTARWRLAAAASGADGRIYAIGGRVGGAVGNDLAEVQAFRPGGLGAWQDVAPLNTARQQLAAASAPCPVTLTPGCVYAIGGSSGPDYLKSVERFTPPTVVRCTVNGVTVTSSPVNGTPGNDAIDCSNSTAVTINGGGGNDVIRGGSGNDQINGDAGNDSINGGGGNDTINGGDGNDSMNGGAGTDTCNGGPGTDSASTCESTSAVP